MHKSYNIIIKYQIYRALISNKLQQNSSNYNFIVACNTCMMFSDCYRINRFANRIAESSQTELISINVLIMAVIKESHYKSI